MTRASGKKQAEVVEINNSGHRADFDRRNRERGEAALAKLKEAKLWLAFHPGSLDPDGKSIERIEARIAEVEHCLNEVPQDKWPSKIDGLWFMAEQNTIQYMPLQSGHGASRV